jgi:hypothetical protein
MSVILLRRQRSEGLQFEDNPRQIVQETLSQKNQHKTGLAEWLKCSVPEGPKFKLYTQKKPCEVNKPLFYIKYTALGIFVVVTGNGLI